MYENVISKAISKRTNNFELDVLLVEVLSRAVSIDICNSVEACHTAMHVKTTNLNYSDVKISYIGRTRVS